MAKEATTSAAPTTAPPKNRAQRFTVAVIASLIVSGLTFLSAWSAHADAIFHMTGCFSECVQLQQIMEHVQNHHKQTGSWPAKLEDLHDVMKKTDPTAKGRALDYWGFPYKVEVKDDDFVIRSLGMDGKPHGAGINGDIWVSGKHGVQSDDLRPTFGQFLKYTNWPGVIEVCSVVALITGIITYHGVNLRGPGVPSVRRTIITGVITGLMAIIVGVILVALHAPSGH